MIDADPWSGYRRLRMVEFAALGTWLATFILIFAVPATHVLRPFWWALAPGPFLWLLIANYRSTKWRCPRCGEPFFRRGFLRTDIWAQECVHCGLPKWTDPSSLPRGA